MVSPVERGINVRVALKDADKLVRDLNKLGPAGERVGRRLEASMKRPNTALRAIDASVARVGRGLQAFDRRFLSLRGGIATIAGSAGFGLLARSALETANQLGDTAEKLGLNVEVLQELRFAARGVGIEFRTTDLALQRFTRRVGEAAAGTGEAKDALAEMGVELRDDNDQIRDTDELLLDVADALAGVTDQAERLRLAFKLFDSEGVQFVNLLQDGSEALLEQRQRARDLGGVMSRELVDNAKRVNTELGLLRLGFTTTFQSGLLTGFLDDFGDIADALTDPELRQAVFQLGQTIGQAFGFIIDNGETILTVLGAIKGAATGAAIGGALGGPGGALIGAGAGGLAGAGAVQTGFGAFTTDAERRAELVDIEQRITRLDATLSDLRETERLGGPQVRGNLAFRRDILQRRVALGLDRDRLQRELAPPAAAEGGGGPGAPVLPGLVTAPEKFGVGAKRELSARISRGDFERQQRIAALQRTGPLGRIDAKPISDTALAIADLERALADLNSTAAERAGDEAVRRLGAAATPDQIDRARELGTEIAAATEREAKLTEIRAEGARVTEALLTPAEQYAAALARINELLAVNAIDEETATRARLRAAESFSDLGRAQAGVLDVSRAVTGTIGDLFRGIEDGSERAIDSLRDLRREFGEIGLEAFALKPLENFLGQISTGLLEDLLAPTAPAAVGHGFFNTAAGGGVVGRTTMAATRASALDFVGAPSFARGGVVPILAHAGETIRTPQQERNMQRGRAEARESAMPQIVINLYGVQDGDSVRRSLPQMARVLSGAITQARRIS